MPAKPKRIEHDDVPMTAPYLPVPVDDITIAFPARVSHLMPSPAEVAALCSPNGRCTDTQGWLALLNGFMFAGIRETAQLLPKRIDGELIDGETAWRHLMALKGTYSIKHEHKEAAFVFLCEQWWEWGIWDDYNDQRHTAGEVPIEIQAVFPERLTEEMLEEVQED